MRALAILALGLAASADAAVILDRSPDAIGGAPGAMLSNFAGGQNLLVGFTLPNGGAIDGFDIYSAANAFYGAGAVAPGRSVLVKLRADSNGAPAASNLLAISTVIAAIDTASAAAAPPLERYHAAFGPITLAAGSYWIGLSGVTPDIGWSRLSPAGPAVWVLQGGDTLSHNAGNVFALGYRVHGTLNAAPPTPSPVPEPAAWTLMVAGFGLAGIGLRRRPVAA